VRKMEGRVKGGKKEVEKIVRKVRDEAIARIDAKIGGAWDDEKRRREDIDVEYEISEAYDRVTNFDRSLSVKFLTEEQREYLRSRLEDIELEVNSD